MNITPRRPVEKPPQTPARPAPDPVEQMRAFCRREGILIDARDCVTRHAVCKMLGRSLSSVDRYVDSGRLVVAFKLNGKPRFTLAAVAALWDEE